MNSELYGSNTDVSEDDILPYDTLLGKNHKEDDLLDHDTSYYQYYISLSNESGRCKGNSRYDEFGSCNTTNLFTRSDKKLHLRNDDISDIASISRLVNLEFATKSQFNKIKDKVNVPGGSTSYDLKVRFGFPNSLLYTPLSTLVMLIF